MKSLKVFVYFALALLSTQAVAFAQETPEAQPAAQPQPEAQPAPAQPTDGKQLVSLAVYPADITLSSRRDFQRMLALATRKDGVTLDVSKEVQWKLADETFASLDSNKVLPKADGSTSLTATFNGLTATATVEVKDATADRPISFHLDVMPVFARTGCNTGSCHGAARGKDGFRLSLFGFDPKGDYDRITREIGFRRINLARPEASLLLQKGAGQVQHTGGKRFAPDSEYYATVLEWLQNSAPQDEGEVPIVEKVDLYPKVTVLEGANASQQFTVRAHYSNGTTRDVTSLATFSSNNDNSAPINEDGLVTAAARGEAYIMARFDTHTVGSQVIVLPENLQYSAPEVTGNYIDELIGEKLRKLRITPSGICSDEEFLRRVTIDITGKLPTTEEYAEFMANQSATKRADLVNSLLERKEFSEIWAMKWAELMMIKSSNQVSYKSMFLYNTWLTEQIAKNVPLDKMVVDLLSASGGTFSEPATNFYENERDTLKTAENVAQIFMGIRTQCAQCHNHPFDRWTMDDYYGFAAFFSQIGRKNGEDYRESIVYNRGGGDVRHPVDNRVMAPKFLGGAVPEIKGEDRRRVMAEWLTSTDNPYFATSIANRVWAHFFGQGIIEPVDDVRVSNPASNPELFQKLGDKLVEYNYDFKQLVRDICNSNAYQRSTIPNESNGHDTRNFAYQSVRRIPAEMLLDCISQVTQTKDKFKGLPLGSRAVQIADGQTSNYFLDTFGRSDRETVCTCEASTDPTLSQALHLLNGTTVENKIREGGLAKTLFETKKEIPPVIEDLYIAALSRKPTEAEKQELIKLVSEAPNEQTGLEDVFWALLNSREFLFNH